MPDYKNVFHIYGCPLEIRNKIKIAAAQKNVTMSEWAIDAILKKLKTQGL